ncbi:hypothetical protein AVEN_133536-1 [Araneus ventricosus]|uniref:Uncharacterized protein n=1 Tax=Araneus ventricosus TaxID=182803 RepID=A0A4Y2RTR7_ARAVE|nr:hypothetical protein AVEN_270650-1 [Araneus ventricosus]GBN78365.1 hypothetical protein AVEN_133536-1 [Araneus ventricosus]
MHQNLEDDFWTNTMVSLYIIRIEKVKDDKTMEPKENSGSEIVLMIELLSDRDEISTRQVVWLVAVAIATGYVREDPFRIGGIRRKFGFYFILGGGKKSS